MLVLLGALAAPPALGADWFYPGPGEERAVLDAEGRLGGLPVRALSAVLVRVTAEDALLDLPEVRAWRRLRTGALRLELRDGVDPFAFSRALRARPGVRWAHPDLAIRLQPAAATAAPPDDPFFTDPFFDDQWHLRNTGQSGWTPGVDIDAVDAWADSQGEGVLIAVLDGGLEVEHPDLDAQAGWDYVDGDADPNPDPSLSDAAHGTCAAGIAAAVGGNGLGVVGVAPQARVYGVRLLGGETTTSDVADALVEAVDAGAGVINNSWGFNNGCSTFTLWSSVREALDYAEEQGRGGLGTVVVNSAGNGNCDNGGDGFQAHEAVISVAASSGHDRREWYSSFGAVVDIAGPSGGIVTTDLSGEAGYGSHEGDPDYMGWFSGTSAAAPVVSGVVALMLAANPRLAAAQVREVLCQTAEPIDVANPEAGWTAEGWSPWYGCGRVDAAAAVRAVKNAPPGAPELLLPVEEVDEGRVLLRWQADDLDGDALSWRLRWSSGGEGEELWLDEPRYELTGKVAAGAEVHVELAAIDAWGEGPAASLRFEVRATPVAEVEEPRGGCGLAVPGGGLLLALGGLARRRRR